MAQNRYHFFALAIFTPAHMAVHIGDGKAQVFGSFQGVVQTLADFHAVGCAGSGFAFHTGDSDIFLKGLDHLILLQPNSFVQIHNGYLH